jgi:Fe-S oxidoreductase
MVTLEEKHSTRGRANALRLAMNGRLDESGLGDAGVFEVLDLCLECRACKAECPVGVDVARFKSEFLADYWRRHGTPLRARAIGRIHTLARYGSALAPIANIVANSVAVRWLTERFLGIDRGERCPRWRTHVCRSRFCPSCPSSPSAPARPPCRLQRHLHQLHRRTSGWRPSTSSRRGTTSSSRRTSAAAGR